MISFNTRNKVFLYCCIAFVVFATRCFNYVNWDITLGGRISNFIGITIVLYFVSVIYRANFRSKLNHVVVLLIVLPLLQSISKYFFYGESLLDEKDFYASLVTFLFFYIFQARRVKEEELVGVLTFVGLIAFFIQMWQQMNPDSALFGVYNPNSKLFFSTNELAEVRNDLYRYRIGTAFITIFCLYYYWGTVRRKFSLANVVLFAVFSVSIYLYLTRQILFASTITILLSFLFERRLTLKVWGLVLALVLGILLYTYSNVLFGELINLTREEVNSTNIRYIGYAFFWEKIVSNPILFFIGHGIINEIGVWQEKYYLFTSDIGLVGEWFLYGFLWVALYFYTLYLILFKYAKKIPMYIKLFVFGTSINSMFIFPYRSPYEYFIWVTILYVSSIYIDKSEKKYVFHNSNPSI